MRRFTAHVHVHSEAGSQVFTPGELVPEWAEPLVTNPDVWEEALEDSEQQSPGEEEVCGDTSPVTAPKKGSSAKKWAAYAAALGFEVDGDATAAQIREDLEASGVQVE